MPKDNINELRAARSNVVSARKKEKQDELREKLQCGEYLRQIEKISQDLEKINRLLKRERKKLNANETGTVKTRILALKTRADINFKRLAKVLPDLKMISLEDENGNNPLAGLIDAITKSQSKE